MPTGFLSSSQSWELVADEYAAEIPSVFAHFVQKALQLAAVTPGMRVLDVATGPGTLALEAARIGAHVTAVDFAARMIEQLRARARTEDLTSIEALVGDGQALTFEDHAFDATFSMFGLIFFPDRARGFRELRRVLRPGGCAVVSSWAPVTRDPFMSALWSALQRAVPLLFSAEPKGPLSQPEELQQEMLSAGFGQAEVFTVSHSLPFPSTRAAWEWFARLSPPVVKLRDSAGPKSWERLSQRILGGLEEVLGPGEARIGLFAHLGVGRK